MRRADNLTTFMCRLSWNLEASTSWNSQGLSKDCFTLYTVKEHALVFLKFDFRLFYIDGKLNIAQMEDEIHNSYL
jgi:hypothetical protein